MRNYIIAATIAASFGFNTFAEAAKCNGKVCGPAVPVICETITLPADVWQKYRLKYGMGQSKAWWRVRGLACGDGCITFAKSYKASSYTCAPNGMQVCFQDEFTGRKYVWTIDGKPD